MQMIFETELKNDAFHLNIVCCQMTEHKYQILSLINLPTTITADVLYFSDYKTCFYATNVHSRIVHRQ